MYHPNLGFPFEDGFVCLNILTDEPWGDKTIEVRVFYLSAPASGLVCKLL